MQTLLKTENLDPQIVQELQLLDSEIAPIDNTPFDLIDQTLLKNQMSESLAAFQKKATEEQRDWQIQDGLLQYQNKLVVPEDDNLHTKLIQEVHNQTSTAHPGRNKTRRLLSTRYYWPNLPRDVAQYIRNCHACHHTTVPRDRQPGPLQPLPIPERP